MPTSEEFEDVMDYLSARLVQDGLRPDSEPNALGLEIEKVVDRWVRVLNAAE